MCPVHFRPKLLLKCEKLGECVNFSPFLSAQLSLCISSEVEFSDQGLVQTEVCCFDFVLCLRLVMKNSGGELLML